MGKRMLWRQGLLITILAAGLIACGQPSAPTVEKNTQAAPEPKTDGPANGEGKAKPTLDMMTGVWQRSGGALTPAKLTAYGKSKSAGTGVFDDPTTRCEGFSIPRSTISEFGVTKIVVEKDVVIISYEGEGDRRIPLDGKTVGGAPGIAGKSIARIVKGAIEIESRDFGPEGKNMMLAPGIEGAGTVYPLSADFTLFERYKPIDKDTLDFVMVMNDPKMTVWPRVFHTKWKRIADEDFIPGECVLPEKPFAATGKGATIKP
jgi:hypothetical protein